MRRSSGGRRRMRHGWFGFGTTASPGGVDMIGAAVGILAEVAAATVIVVVELGWRQTARASLAGAMRVRSAWPGNSWMSMRVAVLFFCPGIERRAPSRQAGCSGSFCFCCLLLLPAGSSENLSRDVDVLCIRGTSTMNQEKAKEGHSRRRILLKFSLYVASLEV